MLVIHLLGDDMTLCNILGLVRRTCSRNVKFHLMNCQFLDFASALEVYSLVQACREQQATRSLLIAWGKLPDSRYTDVLHKGF